jgi:hypothetical protein
VNLAAAHNKLRQAELLCSYLQQLPNEIAQDMRKARSDTVSHRLKLETFFSAAMGAANSSFYIQAKTGGPPFKLVLADWKMNALDQDGRTQFNRMLNLRGTDVHFGEIPAVVLPKMVPMAGNYDPYQQSHYNAVLFGPRPVTEHVNPDGTTVRAYAGLQGSAGLYIEVGGARLEAITVCVWFIHQLRSLVRAADAAAT